MKNAPLKADTDIFLMRELIEGLPGKTTIPDFEEDMQVESVRARTRLWTVNGILVGFAYVDNFNNLRFEIREGQRSAALEQEIVEWGVRCIQESNDKAGEANSLDASFYAENSWQIEMLLRHGFVEQDFRTLRFRRPLGEEFRPFPFPAGFRWRSVKGEAEVEQLAVLHRAAFGTEKMTAEKRLAIMQAPGYERDLDLVAVAPAGKLAAFCICAVEEEDGKLVGYTDPVGVHPDYQERGLGKAIVSVGMSLLREQGCSAVFFGASSKNVAMQRLGESLGFAVVAEKLWFSKEVGISN